MQHRHLVVVGFDEIVANKYLPTIRQAIAESHLDAYSVIDVAQNRAEVEERLRSADPPPAQVVYLPGDGRGEQARAIAAATLVRHARQSASVQVYIATEVQAHETYLRLCSELGLNALVEKPVLAPVVDGRFEPALITKTVDEILALAERNGATHSVMTLARYHQIYNRYLVDGLLRRMTTWGAPLTSLHLRASGGVWNLQHEYEEREDHPYKYGYGMLMHGAYHYVDLAVQLLSLNTAVRPGRRFALELSSFGAFPRDQAHRIPASLSARFDDAAARWTGPQDDAGFGETDVTTAFRLVDADAGRTVTVGTLAFEQTTPSIRAWRHFPVGVYNKNGRTSSVAVEAQVSTLYSAHVHCYDIPHGADPDRIGAHARITTRANASLLDDEPYVAVSEFDGLFHSDSNRLLMHNWLRGTETRSVLSSHLLPMRVTEAIAVSLAQPGRPVSLEFQSPATESVPPGGSRA